MFSVPLVAGAEVVGTLNGYHSAVHDFTDHEVERLTLLANHAAIALASARMVEELRELVDDDATVGCDVGSHYIYVARHFRGYQPGHVLFSNGQQTLGVALPWAMVASMVRPGTQVVSVSGDGGFLFSAQELETATRPAPYPRHYAGQHLRHGRLPGAPQVRAQVRGRAR